jgi:glycogen(starch) synthase
MKVLALVPDYVEKPSGGLGEQYRNIMQKLEGKVEYYTVGYPEENNIKNYKSAKAPLPTFKHIALTTIYGQSIYFLEALKYKEDFDIIHAFDWSTFYAGYLCKEYFKKPLVCTVQLSLKQLNENGIYYCHDPKTVDGEHINILQVNFEELGLQAADKVIHVSEYYGSKYPQYKNKATLLPNGLDLDTWVQEREPKLPGNNKLKFCYIGRASVMKGLDLILGTNIPDDIDFYFIVSPKNAEEPIFSLIKQKCNNKNIFHIPGLYEQDKIDMLYAMDGVVMPSKHEPFGIVALEALMSENLFISTGTGGIREIVDGIVYFNIQTPQDLEQTFEQIKQLPEEEKNFILCKGKERAKQYSWDTVSEKLLEIYNTLLF